MPQAPTVMVAESSDERRRTLGLALTQGGFEVVQAINADEAYRFITGLLPTLVIIHENLDGEGAGQVHARLVEAGERVPPFLVLCDTLAASADDLQSESIYHISSEILDPYRFLQQVRLLLLARDLGGEPSDRLDLLYGDLSKVSIGDLLRVLARYKISGQVRLSIGPGAGVWVSEGEILDAYWAKTKGRKAFNRIAGLRGGSFALSLEEPDVEPVINVDLATLVTDAVDERFQLEEMFRNLPPLSSKLELHMGESFFNTEFAPAEREVLALVQEGHSLEEVIDGVAIADIEVLRFVERMRSEEILTFRQPEHRIHVVTDSICDLQPDVARRNGITVVPLSVVFGQRVFKDGVDLQPDKFYGMLASSSDHPATNPPSKGDFLETYRRLAPTGDVLSIHVSGKQSLTVTNAEQAVAEGAAELAELRAQQGDLEGEPIIRVVDSKVNSGGLGMLAIFATRMVRKGLTLDEIVSRLESVRERLHFLFVVDTLRYLQKGGRIGKAQALLGALLGIKPILGMLQGEVVPVDKVRGGRKVHPRLVELFKERVDPSRPVFASVAHAVAPRWLAKLRDLLSAELEIVELHQGEIGPVVGTHVGPGCVGCILFQPDDEEIELFGPES